MKYKFSIGSIRIITVNLYLSISQVIQTLIPFTNQVLSIVLGRPNMDIISPSYSCNSFLGNPITDAISRNQSYNSFPGNPITDAISCS